MTGIGPQLWTLISTVLAALGVTFEPSPAVKAVIAAAGALVVAVWQWQHHKTIRNADNAAAAAIASRAGTAPAPNVSYVDRPPVTFADSQGNTFTGVRTAAGPPPASPAGSGAAAPQPPVDRLTDSAGQG